MAYTMDKNEILNKAKTLNKVSKETKIAVIMGGASAEREVSLKSGNNCLNSLLELGYFNTISMDMDENIRQELVSHNIEIAFIMLHGTYGEDGYIQQICEDLNIPYTGSKVKASQLCIDKENTKKVLSEPGIICPKSYEKENVCFPVYCKPLDQGSSIGAGVANNQKDLDIRLIEIAQLSDKKPLIEEYIKGRELTIGVLQIDNDVFATDILEIEVKNGEYDYKNKYTSGALIHTSPANIDKNLTEEIKNSAISAFIATKCRGFARIDVILEDSTPYTIEINTIPGMTDTSDLPYQSKTSGIDQNTLINIMLHSALLQQKEI